MNRSRWGQTAHTMSHGYGVHAPPPPSPRFSSKHSMSPPCIIDAASCAQNDSPLSNFPFMRRRVRAEIHPCSYGAPPPPQDILNDEKEGREKAPPNHVSVTLSSLPGLARLRIWVCVINTKYCGDPSNVIIVETKEGTPGPVSEFNMVNMGANHLDFEWAKPLQINGVLTGYQLGIQQREWPRSDPANCRDPYRATWGGLPWRVQLRGQSQTALGGLFEEETIASASKLQSTFSMLLKAEKKAQVLSIGCFDACITKRKEL